MKELDFDDFSPQLVKFLEQHRKEEKKKRDRKKSIDDTVAKGEGDKEEEPLDEEDPPAKKIKPNEESDPVSKDKGLEATEEEGENKDENIKMSDPPESTS